MARVILVRHGQTVWNKEMKYQGHTDIALSSDGIEQAQRVAGRLASEPVKAVYASDLSRAYMTAEKIALQHGLTVTTLPALREICFGDWEGMSYNGINEQWPELMEKLYTVPDEVEIPGGETFRELKERAEKAIYHLVEQHNHDTIVVVSHGGTIRTILCAVLNIHLNSVWNIRQDNTAVNIIDFYDNRVMVALVNDTCHLE